MRNECLGTGCADLGALQARLSARQPVWPGSLRRADLEPHLADHGIVRVADQTGLDLIGIPCWSAIRPMSRGLSVSAGKGMDHDGAWVSAVMESLEQVYGEDVPGLCSRIDSLAGMAQAGLETIPLARQSRCAAERLTPLHRFAWVEGISLKDGRRVFAPYDLIGMDMSAGAPWDPALFRITSLGLAAGADMGAAVLHGLQELVEEEALFSVSASLANTVRGGQRVAIPCPAGHPLRRLIARVNDAGLDARFARVRDVAGGRTIIAMLRPLDPATDEDNFFSGSACRDTLADAAVAALLEAIQTRLSFVAGAREDLFAADYVKRRSRGNDYLFRTADLSGAAAPDGADGTSLGRLVDHVLAGGAGDIYAFALGGVRGVFNVVRVLADDLVSCDRVPGAVLSARASRIVLGGEFAA